MSQMNIIQHLCYTIRNIVKLHLQWILGHTRLFGVREPMSPHLNHLSTITDVYASLILIPVTAINGRCFGHANFIIFILTALTLLKSSVNTNIVNNQSHPEFSLLI